MGTEAFVSEHKLRNIQTVNPHNAKNNCTVNPHNADYNYNYGTITVQHSPQHAVLITALCLTVHIT